MKTIAVSEKAYARLAAWKSGQQDTFSAVIERVVPPKGTIGAALDAAKSLPELPGREFASLEKAVSATRKKLPASWK
jgi:predicted CopG family antitoxin